MGLYICWTICRLTLPTKNPLWWCCPATSCQRKSTVGPILGSNTAKHPSAQRALRVCHWVVLMVPSRKRVAFQLFLTCSKMSALSSVLVLHMATSSLFIEFLFLDFLIAHIGIEIRIRILSASFLLSFSKVRAAVPLMRPIGIIGHGLDVVFSCTVLDVSQARCCPLFIVDPDVLFVFQYLYILFSF